MLALMLIRSGSTLAAGICANKDRALCHSSLLPQAVMVALKLKALGGVLTDVIMDKSWSENCHCEPFSHAVMAALKLNTFGTELAAKIPSLAGPVCRGERNTK